MSPSNVRLRKIFRDLFTQPSRTLLIILAIAVGIFALSVVSRLGSILENDLARSYRAINPASATLLVHNLDDDGVEAVEERFDSVADAEGRQVVWGRILSEEESWQRGDERARLRAC